MLKMYFHNGSNTWTDFHNKTDIYNLFPYQLLSPKMHNKQAFSPGAFYIEHV